MLLGRLMARGDQTVEREVVPVGVRFCWTLARRHNSRCFDSVSSLQMENECLWCEEDEECEECQEHEEEKSSKVWLHQI